MMVCGLVLGGFMFANTAYAQAEGTATVGEKAVAVSTVDAPAKKKACIGMATKKCCKSKAAMGGSVSETSANAGSAKSKKACTAKKKCNKKSAALGGNVTETSANAGSAGVKTKACAGKKKACCKSKKMSSAESMK